MSIKTKIRVAIHEALEDHGVSIEDISRGDLEDRADALVDALGEHSPWLLFGAGGAVGSIIASVVWMVWMVA